LEWSLLRQNGAPRQKRGAQAEAQQGASARVFWPAGDWLEFGRKSIKFSQIIELLMSGTATSQLGALECNRKAPIGKAYEAMGKGKKSVQWSVPI